MRLGQIARKLSVTPSEIVGYLSTRNIILEENANSRLDEDHVNIILRKFAPHLIGTFDIKPQPQEAPIPPAVEEVADAVEPPGLEVEEPIEAQSIVPTVNVETHAIIDQPITLADEDHEIIKAPKVELSGLKVLGKIDLPEPKKKEALPATEDGTAPQEEIRRPYQQRKPRDQRPHKNPVALQREREMKEELEKRKEKAEKDKERKTANYLNKVKHSPPTKAMRLMDEPFEEMRAEDMIEDEPKSWFGKLVKWLRS